MDRSPPVKRVRVPAPDLKDLVPARGRSDELQAEGGHQQLERGDHGGGQSEGSRSKHGEG